MKTCSVIVLFTLFTTSAFAFNPAEVKYEPVHLRGDEQIPIDNPVPYLGSRQSPGDSIGITWYDMQADGSYGQRIDVDDFRQAHIVWMLMDAASTWRYIAWNIRYSDGSYYGQTSAAPSWSGYGHMDITRDLDPHMQRTVIAYHFNPGAGYYSLIDIDGGNAWGTWPNNPQTPAAADHIFPYVAAANNNNIILGTGEYIGNMHHLYLTTDEGVSWSYIAGYDSCALLSLFVRASEKRDTNKVAFVHTRYKTDSVAAGQLDNDVWYLLSDDGGINWGPHINITNYQPGDTTRAYCDVNAVFDDNDYLHIVWAGRRIDSAGNYCEASKIFHWDEFNDTITIVNSPSIYYNEPGGWWIEGSAGDFGAYGLPANHPQLVSDTTNGYLYCLWHGNDDTTDVSAGGYFNGEFYGAYSSDYGITWSDYVNLTNTRSPGAGAGYCYDEDYMTACPKVVTDSIFITYIEDKDAGAYPHSEGVMTENPVRCWVFWTGLIRTGVEEDQGSSAKFQEPILKISPNPFTTHCVVKIQAPESKKQMDLNIYDAAGRVVKSFDDLTNYQLPFNQILWDGSDQAGHPVPAGVYFVQLETGNITISREVIKCE